MSSHNSYFNKIRTIDGASMTLTATGLRAAWDAIEKFSCDSIEDEKVQTVKQIMLDCLRSPKGNPFKNDISTSAALMLSFLGKRLELALHFKKAELAAIENVYNEMAKISVKHAATACSDFINEAKIDVETLFTVINDTLKAKSAAI